MSYNISQWKTKRLVDLKIPLSALYSDSIRKDWLPDSTPLRQLFPGDSMQLKIKCGCEQVLVGVINSAEGISSPTDYKDNMMEITEFQMRGGCSGVFFNDVLRPALARSTGELEATVVWEGGDCVTRLKVKDGVVEETEVEL